MRESQAPGTHDWGSERESNKNIRRKRVEVEEKTTFILWGNFSSHWKLYHNDLITGDFVARALIQAFVIFWEGRHLLL